jgi:hypothetical protein
MAAIAFDTLKFTRRLREAGVPEEQAEAEAEALKEVLTEFASTQLQDLGTRRDLKELEADLKHNVKEMGLRLEIKIVESNAVLVKWVVLMGVAQIALIGLLVATLLKIKTG